LDNEVRASGFSKEIKEFDDMLDEMEAEQNGQGDSENEDEAPELVSNEPEVDNDHHYKEEGDSREANTSVGACSGTNSGMDTTKDLNDFDDCYADELADKFDSDLLVSTNNNKVLISRL